MERRAFNLDDTRKRAARIRTGGGLVAAISMSSGLAMLTVAVSSFFVEDTTAILAGFGVALLVLPFAFIILHGIRQSMEPKLRETIRANLIERQLLLITMQDDAAERLPHLKRKPTPGLEATVAAGSFQDRLRMLAERYHHVCRDAGLEPFPPIFGRSRWVSFVAGMVCLMGNGVFSISYIKDVVGDFGQPIFVGGGMLFLSLFFLLHTMVGAVAAEELVKALDAQE
jgi:hypothetical protein